MKRRCSHGACFTVTLNVVMRHPFSFFIAASLLVTPQRVARLAASVKRLFTRCGNKKPRPGRPGGNPSIPASQALRRLGRRLLAESPRTPFRRFLHRQNPTPVHPPDHRGELVHEVPVRLVPGDAEVAPPAV